MHLRFEKKSMQNIKKQLGIAVIFMTSAIAALTSCGDGKYHAQLLWAEEQVRQNADSCARLLAGIPIEELNSEDEALYGLVSSWLLYRQYAKEIPAEPLDVAFDYYHDSKDPLRRAQVYFLRSVICQDQNRGQSSQWMEDLYSACLAIGQTSDYLLAAQIYQNYSMKFTEVSQFDEARVWVDKFVDAAQLSGNRGEYVQSLIFKANNCLYAEEERVRREYETQDGIVVAQHTQFEETFATIYKALAIALDNQMEVELGRIYTQLSVYHSRSQHSDSLLYYARLATSLNERLYAQGKRKQSPHYVTLSDAFRKTGNADSAIYYARKTFDTPGMPLRNRREAARMIYNVYSELKGDYQTSLEWMRICTRLNDSINRLTIASNIEAVQEAATLEQEKTVLRKEKKHTMGWLMWSIVIGVAIIASILYRLFSNRRHYQRHLLEQEAEFNRKIGEMRTSMSSAIPTEQQQPEAEVPSKVILTGSTREQIVVEASSILFLTSESNYVKVLHLDAEGRIQSKMIRQTISNVESQLEAYPYIIRCHRAFIVNLQHVRHAKSSTSGLQLTLDATSDQVPVSKTYMSLVRSSLV